MSLTKLIDPRSIAIVGVSSKKAEFQVGGRAVFEHLRLHGYPHRIDLITRDKTTIEGVETFTTLSGLPTLPDCVLISVPANDVFGVVAEALSLGVRAFVVLSAGFAEADAEGVARQTRLSELVGRFGAAMLGPNTTGFVNFGQRVAMSSTSRITGSLPKTGAVGLVVQSGALGSVLMEEADRTGIGLSYLISTGNEAVCGLADAAAFLVDDPATKVIALYVEGIREADKMLAVARSAFDAGKPIVLYKAGRSDIGRRAAAGHTGSLIGARGAYDAAIRQLGWVDVSTIEDLLPVAQYLSQGGPARTIGIMSNSGGYGGCIADALESTGHLELPPPANETVSRMSTDLLSFLSTKNPVDIAGAPFKRPEGFANCLDAFADDPAFDTIVVANTPIVPSWAEMVEKAVVETRHRTGKQIAVVWPAETFNSAPINRLRQQNVPVFDRIDTFVTAAAGAAAVDSARISPSRLIREGRRADVVSLVSGELVALSEAASKNKLSSMGLVFPQEVFIPDANIEAIVSAAREIGYPITLKGMAEGVVHKSELGLVAVAVPDEEKLRANTEAMLANVQRLQLRLEGFLVAETVRPRVEVILGLSLDPEFGPMLTLGAGGIYTELLKDVAIRILPVDRNEIRALIRECRISAILDGARGQPALDIEALIQVASDVAALAPRLGNDFAGLELNPVGIGTAGEGAWILDATVFVHA